MDLKTFTAQIELMHQEALRQKCVLRRQVAQHVPWWT